LKRQDFLEKRNLASLEHRRKSGNRFSAPNDAQVTAKASDFFRKMDPFFRSML
jgi:hypothetical protein